MTSYVYRTIVPFSVCLSHVWFDFSFSLAYTRTPLSSYKFRTRLCTRLWKTKGKLTFPAVNVMLAISKKFLMVDFGRI